MRNTNTLADALLLISLSSAPAYAKRHGWENSCAHDSKQVGHLARLKQRLNLTPQQLAEFEEIRTESKQGTTALREETETNRQAIRYTFDAEVIDEPRLRELIRKQAELHAEMLIAKHAIRTKIKQMLGPEQQNIPLELHRQRLQKKETPQIFCVSKGKN